MQFRAHLHTVTRHRRLVRSYCLKQVDGLWDEVTRFENPHTYYVDLSQKLWDIKHELLSREY